VCAYTDCRNSSDDSISVIEHYINNSHVSQIIYNKTNSGSPFVQWSRGFLLAQGELIWIAESDDDCDPRFLEKLVCEFDKDEKLSFAFARSVKMDELGKKYNILQPMFPADLHMNGKQFIKKYLIWGNKVWNASSVLFKKDYALSVNPQYKNFRGAGDWLFWIEMSEKGNVSVISEPLNYYRLYNSNTTNRMRLLGEEDIEDRNIYCYFERKGYISRLDKCRLLKQYAYNIRYNNNYQSSDIRQNSLKLWNFSIIIRFLGYLTYLKYGRYKK